jgi:hypothetical protein
MIGNKLCNLKLGVIILIFLCLPFEIRVYAVIETERLQDVPPGVSEDGEAARCLTRLMELSAQPIEAALARRRHSQIQLDAALRQSEEQRIVDLTRSNLEALIKSGVLDLALAQEFAYLGIDDFGVLKSTLQKFSGMQPDVLRQFLQKIVDRIAAMTPEMILPNNGAEIDAFIAASQIDLEAYQIFLRYWDQMKRSDEPFAQLKLLIFDELHNASDALASRIWRRYPRSNWFRLKRFFRRAPTPVPAFTEVSGEDLYFERKAGFEDRELYAYLKSAGRRVRDLFISRNLRRFTPSQVRALKKLRFLSRSTLQSIQMRDAELIVLDFEKFSLTAAAEELRSSQKEAETEIGRLNAALKTAEAKIDSRRQFELQQTSPTKGEPEFPLTDAEWAVISMRVQAQSFDLRRPSNLAIATVARLKILDVIEREVLVPFGGRLTADQFDSLWNQVLTGSNSQLNWCPFWKTAPWEDAFEVANRMRHMTWGYTYMTNLINFDTSVEQVRFLQGIRLMSLNSGIIEKVDDLIRNHGRRFFGKSGWFEKAQASLRKVIEDCPDCFHNPVKLLERVLRPFGAEDFWTAIEPIAALETKRDELLAQISAAEASASEKKRRLKELQEKFSAKLRSAFHVTFKDFR